MLALEVEFLLGRYAACDYRDRERPEWPPHPSRLFSALAAGAYESGLSESVRAALLWLESLPPPQLHADPNPGVQTPITVFVAVNDPQRDLLPGRTERQPRSFPCVVPETTAVWFIWPDAEPDATLADLLDTVAASVSYLGSSRSPVRVRRMERPPVPNWVPDDTGTEALRVPTRGRLNNLDWHHEHGLRPSPGAVQRYCRPGGPLAGEPAHEGVHDEMVVYRLADGMAMEIETTLKLTEVLRAAALRRAEEVGGPVPEILSGHSEPGVPSARTHIAYVALPFVSESQVHADGRVLGVAAVLPRGLSPDERRSVMRALVRIDHLTVHGVGRLTLERVTPDQTPLRNLRAKTWSDPSARWASATPVLLDRFPKTKQGGISEVLARACEHAGLPRPTEVWADRNSPLHGVEPSFRFLTRRRVPGQAGAARLHTHAVLTFDRPVRGPVLLGAGRYFGLGLFRPLREMPADES